MHACMPDYGVERPEGAADIYGGMAIFHTLVALPHFITPQQARPTRALSCAQPRGCCCAVCKPHAVS